MKQKLKNNIVAIILATILLQIVQYSAQIYSENKEQICMYMLIFLCIKEVSKSG